MTNEITGTETILIFLLIYIALLIVGLAVYGLNYLFTGRSIRRMKKPAAEAWKVFFFFETVAILFSGLLYFIIRFVEGTL